MRRRAGQATFTIRLSDAREATGTGRCPSRRGVQSIRSLTRRSSTHQAIRRVALQQPVPPVDATGQSIEGGEFAVTLSTPQYRVGPVTRFVVFGELALLVIVDIAAALTLSPSSAAPSWAPKCRARVAS